MEWDPANRPSVPPAQPPTVPTVQRPTEPPVQRPTEPPVQHPVEPTVQRPTAPPTAPSPYQPQPVVHPQPLTQSPYPTNHHYTPIKRTNKRAVPITIASVMTILVTFILIASFSPPGTMSFVDEMRDRDGDGLSDAQELKMGSDPENADTDGDGFDDDEEDCPIGDEDWTSTSSSDHDGDGCRDSGEDDDDDNDGIRDSKDECPEGKLNWIPTNSDDRDGDGCHDSSEDDDDDNDGWSDVDEQDCGTSSEDDDDIPSDFDGDKVCDFLDADDDNDGVLDSNDAFPFDASETSDFDGDGIGDNADWDDDGDTYADYVDVFPFDPHEWADFDEDGIGDNADTDDDNDGVLDYLDYNDNADVGLKLTYDTFKVITKMDYWDDQAEVYICTYVDSENVGCGPDREGYHWSLTTSTTYSLGTEIFVDLPETKESHNVQICAWDNDAFDDDRIDISSSSSNNCYNLAFYTTYIHSGTLTVSGEGDGQGWDGEMKFSYEVADLRIQRMQNFQWTFDGSTYSMNVDLDYSIYSEFKAKDHTVGGVTDPDSYAVFATPHEQYVIDLAQDLKSKANSAGYHSDYDVATFVYAFVGDIQYEFDIEGIGVSDYPKYPIEMLWTATGDCEDAAILYISLVEALGYDAILATGFVKNSDDDDWGGHAWAIVNVDGASGTYWTFSSKGSNRFYFVEATGYSDGVSYIGRNPWYDIDDDVYFADVE